MECVNILIDYFSMFKMCEEKHENNEKSLKEINHILDVLNRAKEKENKIQYFTEFDTIENIAKKYDVSEVVKEYYKDTENSDIVNNINKGIDNILYDIFYNIDLYNNYLADKRIKSYDLPITADISFGSLDVKLQDVLNYLEIKEEDLDSRLIDDLSKMVNLDKFKEFAIAIKTDNGMKRVLFDKIEDKNVLVSILLHSNLDIVNSIIDIFEKENCNLNKVVNNIPSIFIKDLVSSKCKYTEILTNYDNFINNYKLLKDNDVSFKKMLNQSVFLVNDYNTNKSLIDKLDSLEGQI